MITSVIVHILRCAQDNNVEPLVILSAAKDMDMCAGYDTILSGESLAAGCYSQV